MDMENKNTWIVKNFTISIDWQHSIGLPYIKNVSSSKPCYEKILWENMTKKIV